MSTAAVWRASPSHIVAGLTMLAAGAAGVVWSWDALGLVARGVVPFALLCGGLVMIGAGGRALRAKGWVVTQYLSSLGPLTPLLATVACLLLAAAAASNLHVGVPQAWSPGLVAGYVALGLVSGIIGGMLGLGGGLVHLSGLTLLFGLPFGFARGATLINNVFINGAAAVRYGRRGLVLIHVAAVLLPMALVGVTAGAFLQENFDESVMRKIFAGFLLLVIGGMVVDTLRPSPRRSDFGRAGRSRESALPAKRDAAPLVRHGVTGALAGVFSGILGISGGIVAVPGQTLLTGVPLRNAIANSTVITAISSALGTALLFVGGSSTAISGSEMATIAVLFIPGNLIGGHFGATWMERLPVVAVRGFFITALVAIAVRSWRVVL